MKHIRILQTITIIAAFGGIADTMAQSVKSDTSYFPLQIGNQWSYSSNSSKLTIKILDTATINGHLYYDKSNGDTSIPMSYRSWYRCSNDTVFLLVLPYNSVETPLYYLHANVGDTIPLLSGLECMYGLKSILVGKEDTISTPSGNYFHCYHFRYEKVCIDAGMNDTWLGPGIGVVKYKYDSFAGEGIYTLDSSVIPTSVNQAKNDIAVSSYLLLDCYPNPFNPQTTLTYKLDKGSHVSLEIFDLLGRKLVQLVDEFKGIGTYHVSWNAEEIPSGAYFAVLRANNFSITKKLVLQK